MAQLFPYQQAGVEFLAGRKAALLADDPGLGKTLQAIRACDATFALRVLVICPASVVENWRREIAKYREGDWQAAVFSYDMSVERYRGAILKDQFDVIIIDEAHYLKEVAAKRTRAIYGFNGGFEMSDAHSVAARGQQTFLLTGTPMPNHPAELYTHLRALHPQSVLSPRTQKPWTYAQFEERYCKKRDTSFGRQIVGSQLEPELHKKLHGFMLRRRKADVLPDLPPLMFGELFLEANVDGLAGEEIDTVRKTLAKEGVEGLRRIAANGSVSTLRRLTGMAKAVPAANWIRDWLDSTPADRKIVVFAHHHDVIETLYDRLHLQAVRVNGGMKQAERQRSVDRLQGDPKVRVFIGQITAAGVGLTLTKASDLLFVESSWVPAEMEQAAQRIHRIGQTEPCLVRTAMVAGSIDEDIQRAIVRKMQSIEKVVDGV